MSLPEQISIVFEKKGFKPTIAATGAFGGPSPDHNSVIVHLYIEHHSIPSHTTHAVQEGGIVELTAPKDTVVRGDITREVVATLVLAPETAVNLGNWLTEKGTLAKSRRM